MRFDACEAVAVRAGRQVRAVRVRCGERRVDMQVTRRSFSVGAAGLIAAMLAGCANTDEQQAGSASTGSAPATSEATTRATQYGEVTGAVSNGVEVYYNIPYGKEPEGELRWHAPQAPDAWDEPLDCAESSKKALQMASVTNEDGETERVAQGTTDCLNLDVYTTADADKLPVMVYVHGGNNQTGTAAEIPGFEVVKQAGAVYVSLDYRLGLLGYNCLPALLDDDVTTGNFGMLDIAAALQWVRDNIDQFGGDPNNVTVSGFSAGGRNVMAMLVSPMFEGLFDRAIAFSGGMSIANQEESVAVIAQTIAPLAVEDGKAENEEAAAAWLTQGSDEVRSYLYDLDAERLTSLMSDAGIRMSAFPHLFGDDVMLPSTGFGDAEYVNDVPLIMLTGTSEFSMFCAGNPAYEECGEEAEAAFAFADAYGSDLYRIFNTQTSAATMDEAYSSNIYCTEIHYGAADSDNPIETYGSFHGIFAPALGSSNYDAIYDFSESGYQDMAKQFLGYLKNFLATGDPSKGMDVAWPEWTIDSKQTLVLDAADGKAAISAENVYKEPLQIIDEAQADTTVSDETKQRVLTEVMNGRWFSTLLDEMTGTPQAVHLLG